MANTFSASLVTDMLADRALTTLQNRLASLAAFSIDFGTDRMKPKATVQVELVTSGAAVQTNPTNWESGDSINGAVSVTVDQYSVSFHITNEQLQQGRRLERLIDANVGAFCDKLIDVVMTPITTVNYGAASVVAASGAFGADELRILYGALKKSEIKTAVLDSDYFARFLPDTILQLGPRPGLCGFNNVYENTRWTGAGANVIGFASNPQALAIASGLPLEPAGADGEFIALDTITLPGLGLIVEYSVWFSRGSRTLWASLNVMLGAKAADTTALKLIKNA